MEKIGSCVKTLVNATTYNANTNVDITEALQSVQWVAKPALYISATEINNGTTLDVDIQISADGGTTYNEVLSMTQLSANGNELKEFTIFPAGDKVRMALTFGAAGNNWTLTAKAVGQIRGAQ